MERAEPSRSWRRSLCLVVVGVLAALAPSSAAASDGDDLVVGKNTNLATSTTQLNHFSNSVLRSFLVVNGAGGPWPGLDSSATGVIVGYSKLDSTPGVRGMNSVANGVGVFGESVNSGTLGFGGRFEAPGSLGFGVYATGGAYGVRAVGPTGVWATGTTRGVNGSTVSGSGVYGENTGSTGIGVEGRTGGVGSAVYGHATANGAGVYGESETGTGTYGVGGPRGVYGSGTATGVEGLAGNTGTGVYGHNSGSTGIGVHGQTGGVGSAVFGEATVNGVGVYGKSQSGTALRGDSPSGTALQVNGKAKFSRSGIVIIAAGTASKAVSLAGVTAASMVVATAQQNGSVFVKAAVPAAGSFNLFLNGNAPVGGLKVAYFVLN